MTKLRLSSPIHSQILSDFKVYCLWETLLNGHNSPPYSQEPVRTWVSTVSPLRLG